MSNFGRSISVSFRNPRTNETIEPDGDLLNIGFTVERNLDIEPNTLSATIFNLRKDTQERLKDTASGWEVTLSAGYRGSPEAIFTGAVRVVRHRREPPLLATDIEADDGGEATSRFVTRHFPRGTTVGTVFRWLQEQSGLGVGNAARIAEIRTDKGIPDRLENGTTIRGYVLEEMADIARSRGARVSSQSGEVSVLRPGEALAGLPVTKLTPATGLIGYPYVDNEGTLTLNHRMLPNVFPGAPIDVDSASVAVDNARFVVERAVYSGSLFDDDFNIEIEGRQAE